MKTTIKQNIPEKLRYSLDDLEDAYELKRLIRQTESELLPCPKCGKTDVYVVYSYTPSNADPHYFHVACFPCLLRTYHDCAADNEVSIKNVLQYVSHIWNRRPDNP